jgi:hypothetical protein
MESNSLQLMYPNCKPIHARAYTVPRSVEQQLLVDSGVLEKDYSFEWSYPSFQFLRKTEQ